MMFHLGALLLFAFGTRVILSVFSSFSVPLNRSVLFWEDTIVNNDLMSMKPIILNVLVVSKICAHYNYHVNVNCNSSV